MSNFLDKTDKSMSPVPHGDGCSKAVKHQWPRPINNGVMMFINKAQLNLDD